MSAVRAMMATTAILEHAITVTDSTSSSTRSVGRILRMPQFTTWRLLNGERLQPYHFQRVQALIAVDYPRYIDFGHFDNQIDPYLLTERLDGGIPYVSTGSISRLVGRYAHRFPTAYVVPVRWSTNPFCVRVATNVSFPGRWFGWGGPVVWSPRSLDLPCLDFILWGQLNSKWNSSPDFWPLLVKCAIRLVYFTAFANYPLPLSRMHYRWRSLFWVIFIFISH